MMHNFLLVVVCAVALSGAAADDKNGVKQRSFPFMAFLYYPDETILEGSARFKRNAALIRKDWLISSGDVSKAFPQKTLLARAGAVTIDANFTLNEDVEEQEREVILILRPYNYNATEWWETDISLLKTLLPFNTSLFVASASLFSNPNITGKNCYILIYAALDNTTNRFLQQMMVQILPSSEKTCGNQFRNDSMICAADTDKSIAAVDPFFCQGNRGGPLVCDNELTGLQMYVNDCEVPYLYQLVTGWTNLIACAEEQRYLTQQCADVCVAIPKDPQPVVLPDVQKFAAGDMVSIQSAYPQYETDVTTLSTTIKVEKPARDLEPRSVVTEINDELKPTKTSILIQSSQDTTSYTKQPNEPTTKEPKQDTPIEHDRKKLIEAKQQAPRNEASLNIPFLCRYMLSGIYVLLYIWNVNC